jgi:Protein of unknown function (DUF3141)
MRCEARSLEDIRALGGNDAADERRFATAAKVSEINLALYRTFAQPIVRSLMPAGAADTLRQLHPLRLQYELFSDKNPMMGSVADLADRVRADRQPVSSENWFTVLEQTASEQIVGTLDAWRDATEAFAETMFLSIYGSPALQAAVGIDPADEHPRKAGKTQLHREVLRSRIAELRARIATGGLRECLARGLLYVGMARGGADERGFAVIRRMRGMKDDGPHMTLAEFKCLVREQYLMLLIDQEAALEAIPDMLPPAKDARQKGLAALRDVLSARGEISGEAAERLQRIAQLFGMEPPAAADEAKAARHAVLSKAS